MTKKDLDRAFNRGLVIVLKTVGEGQRFLKEIKSFGGKWLNGDEIEYNEEKLDSTEELNQIVHVDKKYLLSFVSGMCYHYGAYPTVEYSKFKHDSHVIDIE